MKKIIILLGFIGFAVVGFSQGVKAKPALTKANYAKLTLEQSNIISKEKMIVVNTTTTFQTKSVDLTVHSIHPDLIVSKKQLNQEIKLLRDQVRNSNNSLQLIELRKQLVELKFRKTYLRKNQLN